MAGSVVSFGWLLLPRPLPLLLALVDLRLWNGDHGAEEVVHLLEWG